MKIGIVSDTHLGFGKRTEREEDPFRNLEEALKKVSDTDLVLMPGDIFDTKVPSQEVLSKTVKIFRKHLGESEITIKGLERDSERTPVIAIHGTHERRGKDSVNPVELMSDAGFMHHLHNEHITVEKDDEKVSIFGMSGVPERYAPRVLKRWNPVPEEGYNILMFHQSVEGFVYTDSEKEVLKLSDMPEGFEILVDGHIHWRNLDMRSKKVPLIFPGSTITTQMNKKEMESRKGVVVINTEENSLEVRILENTRNLFREEVEVTGLGENDIVERAVETIQNTVKNSKKELKPLFRLSVTGKTDASVRVSEIKNKVENVILKIGDKTVSPERRTEEVEMGEEDVREVGVSILSEKVGFEGFEELFESLVEGDTDSILEKFRSMSLEELKEFLEEEDKKDSTEDEPETQEVKEEDGAKTGGNILDYVQE